MWPKVEIHADAAGRGGSLQATMRRALLVTTFAVAATALSACGESSKSSTTSSALPPAQYENGRRIEAYVQALSNVEAPFAHPPAGSATLAHAVQVERTAIAELSSLTPPSQFQAAHAKILAGHRGELAQFEIAKRTHNKVALSNAEAKNAHASELVQAALVEAKAVLDRCKQDNFSC
jgi:hypothetical protein